MTRHGYPPAAVTAATYAAAQDGDVAGLPDPGARLLVRLGLAEPHPRRLSYLGNAAQFGYNRIVACRRLTAAGFEAAGRPQRAGLVRLVFRRPDAFPGRSVALMCRDGRLRVVLAELEPARSASLVAGRRSAMPGVPGIEVEDHDEIEPALDAFEAALERARVRAAADGFLVDPAYLAWDGVVLSLEELDADGAYPVLAASDVLARLREAVPGAGPTP